MAYRPPLTAQQEKIAQLQKRDKPGGATPLGPAPHYVDGEARSWLTMEVEKSPKKLGAGKRGMLVGWKRIAMWLGVSQCTAVKWHEEYGMPVIKIMSRKVRIHEAALAEWWFKLDRLQRSAFADLLENNEKARKTSGYRAWRRWVDRKENLPEDGERVH